LLECEWKDKPTAKCSEGFYCASDRLGIPRANMGM
jgi:hypothetical protein